jgi:hypothetical protein
MRQAGEDASLTTEAFSAAAAEEREVQELDRRPALESPVAALGKPDGAHSALGYGFEKGVNADRLAGEPWSTGKSSRASLEKAFPHQHLVLFQHRLETRSQDRVLLVQPRQPGNPFLDRHLQSLVEIRTDLLPPIAAGDRHHFLKGTDSCLCCDEDKCGLSPIAGARYVPIRPAWRRFR